MPVLSVRVAGKPLLNRKREFGGDNNSWLLIQYTGHSCGKERNQWRVVAVGSSQIELAPCWRV